MNEWEKIEEILDGDLKKIELLLAFSPVQPYRVAKVLEEKGFAKNRQSILIDYSRLSNTEYCTKKLGLSNPVYRVIKEEKVHGRTRKYLQVNYDYLVELYMKEVLDIHDSELIRKVKKIAKELSKSWKPSLKVSKDKELEVFLKHTNLTTIFSSYILAAIHNTKILSNHEKKELVKTIIERIGPSIIAIIQPILLPLMDKKLMNRMLSRINKGIYVLFDNASKEFLKLILEDLVSEEGKND